MTMDMDEFFGVKRIRWGVHRGVLVEREPTIPELWEQVKVVGVGANRVRKAIVRRVRWKKLGIKEY